MKREVIRFNSKKIGAERKIITYGHFGYALLLFPALSDDPLEPEENGMIESIEDFINSGRFKVYSIPSINRENWLCPQCTNEEKSQKHAAYNEFLNEEVIPIIFDSSGGAVPMLTAGASYGGYHAANIFFRRPDLIIGTFSLSSFYDIRRITGGYFDDNCYYNSPKDFISLLNDDYWLSYLRSRKHIYIASGSGEGETPEETRHFSNILFHKGITHHTDIWNENYSHDYKSWNDMLRHYVGTKL